MRLASESGKDIVGVVVVIISWPTFPLPLMMDIVRRARTAPRPSQRPASPRPLSIYLAIRDSQPPEISCFFILNIFDEVRVGHLTLSLMFNKVKDQVLEPLSTSSIDASVRPRATYDDLLLVRQSLLRMMIRMDDVTNHRKRGRKDCQGLPNQTGFWHADTNFAVCELFSAEVPKRRSCSEESSPNALCTRIFCWPSFWRRLIMWNAVDGWRLN